MIFILKVCAKLFLQQKEEKKIDGPRHMLRYTGPINRALVEQGVARTSSMLAPIMLLEGDLLKSNSSSKTISRPRWRNLLREIRQRRKNIRLSWTRSPHILLGRFWRVLELSSNTECAQGSKN
jgi:hypothetical protein